MNDVLKQAGYILEPSTNVWCKPGYGGIAYSDGDEIEQRIAAIIRDASDITVLSTELRSHCTDWPSLYHLSGSRSNILRPLEQSLTGDILEIGAGCGAITRYLGECSANVLALEGSPRRAKIARSRSRDLNNVKVLAEKFDQFHCDKQFDVVTLIGVLEYANLFTASDNPARTMLERVRALLKPNGKLIVAIENQLGLKYFAGAPEDHLGQPMYGIEGRYQKDQPQTFGKRVLQNLLKDTGFTNSAFMAPLPDYKLPASIVTEAGFSDPDFDAGALAWQSARRDPQLPPIMSFSPELAWPVVADNGLGLDLANSFLIVASDSQVAKPKSDILAYHYSTDRRPEFCKETTFIKHADSSDIKVQCRLLSTTSKGPEKGPVLFRPEAQSDYTPGKPLSWAFIKIVSRDGWRIEEAVDYLKRYLDILSKLTTTTGEKIEVFTDESKKYVHGEFIDAIPQNIICLPNNVYRLIDREWQGTEDVSIARVVFRSILLQMASITRFGQVAEGLAEPFTRKAFVVELFYRLGLHKEIDHIPDFLNGEAVFQEMVTGRSTEEFMQWWPENILATENLSSALLQRDEKIHTLNRAAEESNLQMQALSIAAEERDAKIHALSHAAAERDSHIQNLTNTINEILGSTSWRISAPYRFIGQRAMSLNKFMRRLFAAIKRRGGPTVVLKKGLTIYRTHGITGLRHGIKILFAKTTPNPAGLSDSHDRNDYAEWIRRYDTITDITRTKMRHMQSQFDLQPIISVVMPTYNPKPEWLIEAIESVRNQIYPNWELCIADDASTDSAIRPILEGYATKDSRIKVVFREQNGHISAASNSALGLAAGEWVALLDHDDLLAESALFWVVETINQYPDAGLIYSDEDKLTETAQRTDPYFKCDWNPDLFYSHNMISHLGVYKLALVRGIDGFRKGLEGSQDYDLALRCIEKLHSNQVIHIPRILYHWRVHPESTAMTAESKPYAMLAGERAINEHFVRTGVKGKVSFVGHGYQPTYELPDPPPLVSIVIPTRNCVGLLKICIDSIFKKTIYKNYEIIVIDNGSDELETLNFLQQLLQSGKIRLIRDDGPFNYSRLNNKAINQANGELIALLNNDIEVITPSWLNVMVSHALRPEIGAVGAKLLYKNKTIQHAGIILGGPHTAIHAHKNFNQLSSGYMGWLLLTINYSAVTGACLVIRKEIFEKVGGLNEEKLAVAFNDVDFCLRIRELGYRNLWTPHAELFHHESATRGYEDTSEKKARFLNEIQYMKERWGEKLLKDPAYNQNLTLDCEDFSYAWPPRVLMI